MFPADPGNLAATEPAVPMNNGSRNSNFVVSHLKHQLALISSKIVLTIRWQSLMYMVIVMPSRAVSAPSDPEQIAEHGECC